MGGRRVSISNQPRPKHAETATTTDTSVQFGSSRICEPPQNSFEAPCRSHENEEGVEGVNEDSKADYPRPIDAAHASATHRRIEPAHEYQEGERKRNQTSHTNAGDHPAPQAEDVRKKDRADTRINQPAGKGVGA